MQKTLKEINRKVLLFFLIFAMSFVVTIPIMAAEADNHQDGGNGEVKIEEKIDETNENDGINWGEIKVKGLENLTAGYSDMNKLSYDFTYELVGADSGVKVIMLESKNYNLKIYYDKTTETTGLGTVNLNYSGAGRNVIQFHLYALPSGSSKIVDYDISIKPQKIEGLSLKKITAWQTEINFDRIGNKNDNGDKILLQWKKDGEWTDLISFEAGGSYMITELKPDTKYSFRLAGMASGDEPGDELLGHWVGTVWIDAKTIAPGRTSTANFKIVLKSKPKGSVGAIVFDKFYKLKGNTIQGKVKMRGAMKGKKTKIEVTMVKNKDYKGYSLTSKPKTVIFK